MLCARRQVGRTSVLTVLLLAAGAVSACTTTTATPPQTVAVNEPSVTYRYDSDEGLIEAGRKADAYCARYGAAPRPANVSPADSQGFRTVRFECAATEVPVARMTAPPPTVPATSYSYRTDLDLIQASKNAESYCRQRGMRESTAHIVSNADGTKTVTFECIPA